MIRFAIVGCGRIAKRHADLLSAGLIQGAHLVAVCDTVPQRMQAFAKKYGVPGFGTIEALLSQPGIDAVSVLTPSGLHADHTVAALQAGCDVVVEKPMALTLADADRMVQAAEATGRRLFVVKQNRFNVPVVKARAALDAGRLGRLVLGTVRVRWCRDQTYYAQDSWRGTWAQDGGVIANQASHHVDMLSWFMGPVQSVHARGTTALVDIQAEDTCVATIKFKNGALGIVEATGATRPKDLEGSLSVLGSGGCIEISGFAVNQMRHWNFVEPDSDDATVLERFSVNPPNVYGFGHQAYYQHVVDCMQTGKPGLVEGREGRHSLELVVGLYEAMATGGDVTFPVQPQHTRLGRG